MPHITIIQNNSSDYNVKLYIKKKTKVKLKCMYSICCYGNTSY